MATFVGRVFYYRDDVRGLSALKGMVAFTQEMAIASSAVGRQGTGAVSSS